jgi:hypothetical protein
MLDTGVETISGYVDIFNDTVVDDRSPDFIDWSLLYRQICQYYGQNEKNKSRAKPCSGGLDMSLLPEPLTVHPLRLRCVSRQLAR